MLKLWSWILFTVFYCAVDLVISMGDIGPGLWYVNYINKCEESNHKFKFDIKQHKINRTHDGFNVGFIMDEAFTDTFGVRIDICKNVDGGCKPYQVLSDECFVTFVNKYAENNVNTFLGYAKIDPPEFPIKKGEYDLSDYVFNFCELPKDGLYGSYSAKAFILEGVVEVGCVEAKVEFKEIDDDEDVC